MTQINLNFFQVILLIVFIYVFTYFWLPQNDGNTEQYLKLLEKYNKVVDDKKRYKEEYNKLLQIQSTSVGKSVSAHSGRVNPGRFNQNDNILVDEILG